MTGTCTLQVLRGISPTWRCLSWTRRTWLQVVQIAHMYYVM